MNRRRASGNDTIRCRHIEISLNELIDRENGGSADLYARVEAGETNQRLKV